MKLLLCFLGVTLAAQAGEYVILSSGFRLHADHHVIEGQRIQIHTSEGVIEMPVDRVASFEPEEYAPAPPAPVVSKESAAPAEARQNLTPQELTTRAAIRAGLPPAIVHSV